MVLGYSDRINHALAFAAKHHDRQVRKGTRMPYRTHPANVALILTRYEQDEDTVVAGILYDVVEDWIREHYKREMLEQRITEKFGTVALKTLLSVTERLLDDNDVELSLDERKDDCLERLAAADTRARWVCAADRIHEGGTILADLRRTIDPESVWTRFHSGRDGTIRWHRRVYDRLQDVGFVAPIMDELRQIVEALERLEGAELPSVSA